MRGQVKFFLPQKSYGYITAEDGSDYFVHSNHVLDSTGGKLNQGESVIFDIGRNNKGECAVNVIREEQINASQVLNDVDEVVGKEAPVRAKVEYIVDLAKKGESSAGVCALTMTLARDRG